LILTIRAGRSLKVTLPGGRRPVTVRAEDAFGRNMPARPAFLNFEFPARAGAEALPLVRFHPARPFAGLLLSWLSALLQNMPAPD